MEYLRATSDEEIGKRGPSPSTSSPRTKDLLVGAPVSTPRTMDLSVGAPVWTDFRAQRCPRES